MEKFSSGHAVIVGVGDDLPYTANDAEGIADILRDEARCAYPPDQVELLIEEEADRPRVLKALEDLAGRTDEDSAVVIYYSGHGYRVAKAGQKDYFLLPHGYDLADLGNTAISDAEFTAALSKLKVKRLLLLLDCCHAAGLDQTKAPGVSFAKDAIPPQAEEMLKKGEGRAVIASSRSDELSLAGKPYSVFTRALIESLSGLGAAKKDGLVRIADLAMYAAWRVPGQSNNQQHPVLNFEKADNFAVAYYAGGDAKPKGAPFAVPDAAVVEREFQHWAFVNYGVIRADNVFQGQTIDLRGAHFGPKTDSSKP